MQGRPGAAPPPALPGCVLCVCVCVCARVPAEVPGPLAGAVPGPLAARPPGLRRLARSPAFLFLLPEDFYAPHAQSPAEGCSPGRFGVVFNFASFARYLARPPFHSHFCFSPVLGAHRNLRFLLVKSLSELQVCEGLLGH